MESNMKTKLLLMFFFLVAAKLFAQYPEVSIRDIQFIGSDSLNTYWDDDVAGPYEGDTVTVTGIVMVPPYNNHKPDSGTIVYLGSLAGFYMQDTAATDWSGILVYISNPGDYPDFQNLDSGTVVKVTGVVTHYVNSTQKTTELALIDFTADNILNFVARPEPVILTLDSLKEIGTSNTLATAEKWEGVFVEIRDVRVFDRNWTSGGFRIIDDNNTSVSIYTRSNNLFGHNPPPDNSVLEYVRGFIESRAPDAGGAAINPMYLTDYKITLLAPTISEVTRDSVEVGYGQQVTITANIEDVDGSVVDASMYYRINSSYYGVVPLTNSTGNNWTGVIPAQSDSSMVDFYIAAEDNQGNISNNPSDTTTNRYFYLVIDRPLTIQDVQYSPLGGGFSGYNGYDVTVTGVVTADTTDIEGDGSNSFTQVYIQNGTGPWSGIRINGTEVLGLERGDNVTVTGTVGESFGITLLSGIDSPTNVTVNSSGNPLPEPELLPTSTFDDVASGIPSAEQWEGVLLKFENLTVTDENADGSPGPGGGGNSNFGEILVDDGSGAMRVELQDGIHQYHNYWDSSLVDQPTRIKAEDHLDGLIGIQWYSFGDYKLIPRKGDDFINLTGVVDEYVTPVKYSLNQNYPNPFNPTTIISYNIPKAGLVTLKVYNLLGQLVKTLVNEEQSPGNYKINFDAGNLSSGVYFYRITSGDFSNVKKMLFIK
jgi:hypothetical protein